jgi:sigma-B regulation protein RsbU (phosphoserine phosphatase)
LLGEVDAALKRFEDGSYGLCETCHDPIEPDRLMADPLVRYCVDHLSPAERQALEEGLKLASQVQAGLLPRTDLQTDGWEATFHYQAAEVVGGDYCDLLPHGGSLFFAVGDVSGKGLAAAMLMANLQATFRLLVAQDFPLHVILQKAGRMFCESTMPAHYATLACGRADPDGRVEIGIAGHLPILVTRRDRMDVIDSTGIPLGMFCCECYSTTGVNLERGEMLTLYTDGLSEAVNPADEEYGTARLGDLLRTGWSLPSGKIIGTVLQDLESYRSGAALKDDLTLLIVRRR